ncbi:MAG TPA: hypothetical protein VJ807_03845 [Gaiellaceae bacterium]|nr:hypothetical protein [Gaiellaceae bacterium]
MTDRAGLARDLVVVACALSAGIHAALTPSHFGEGGAAGGGFLAAAVLLGAMTVALTRHASAPLLALAAVTLAGLIASYAAAITSGLPILHPSPEPIDGLAVATKLVEAVGLAAALDLLWHGRPAVAFHPARKGTTT